MTELTESIGQNVRRLREEKGWNQTELAFRSKMSTSIISLLENGKRNASTNTLARIAGALGVEVVDLFPKVLELPPDPDGVRRIRIQGEVSERTRRHPWSLTVTHTWGLEDVLEDVEAGRTEEAASKLRELIGSTA